MSLAGTGLLIPRERDEHIEAAKRMELACRDWRAKPAADKTWNNLKLEMKAAHLDLNLTLTTDTGGYGAHQAEEIDEGYLANMIDHQKVTTATITALMETVQLLSNQVKDFTASAKPKPDNKEANKSSGCNDNAKARRNLRAEHGRYPPAKGRTTPRTNDCGRQPH